MSDLTPYERWVAAADPNIDPDLLRSIALDPDIGVRSSVLSNLEAPRKVLELMLEHYPDMREAVAHHPNAPLDLKEELIVWRHSITSLRRYSDELALPDSIRRAIMAAHSYYTEVTLGEVAKRDRS